MIQCKLSLLFYIKRKKNSLKLSGKQINNEERFGTAINQKHPEDAFQGLSIQNDDEGVDDFFDGFGKDQFFQVKYLDNLFSMKIILV